MRTFSIAIVGAGPSGYFAAQALQNMQTESLKFSIDMFERLPTPWGLVRSGVAPDHQKIKSVSKVFEKVATNEGFNLYCNVELGSDIQIDELKTAYDSVVIAIGASEGKKLQIPGEQLKGSISAAEFVPWYNAHPDFTYLEPPFGVETAIVIGVGNVAMDVGRMLAHDPKHLEATDVSDYALSFFAKSKIRNVHVFGRRGPEHASFSTSELRELSRIQDINVIFDEDEILGALSRIEGIEGIEKEVRLNLEIMLSLSKSSKKSHNRSLFFHFLSSPIEIRGQNEVEEVIFGRNELREGTVVPTHRTFTVRAGLLITAIGYSVKSIQGIPLTGGRVANNKGQIEKGNVFVVGWAKRGPIGVIGSNKSDSQEVMKLLVSNLRVPRNQIGLVQKLRGKGIRIITQQDWEKINQAELLKGESLGKPRVKFTSREEMLGL